MIGVKPLLEEAGFTVVKRKELDLLRDVAAAAKAIREGYSDIRWEEFCEAIDAMHNKMTKRI